MNDEDSRRDDDPSVVTRIRRLIKGEPDSREELIELLDDKRWTAVLQKQEYHCKLAETRCVCDQSHPT